MKSIMNKNLVLVIVFLLGSFSVWAQKKKQSAKVQTEESTVQMQAVVDDGDGGGGGGPTFCTYGPDPNKINKIYGLTASYSCGFSSVKYTYNSSEENVFIEAYNTSTGTAYGSGVSAPVGTYALRAYKEGCPSTTPKYVIPNEAAEITSIYPSITPTVRLDVITEGDCLDINEKLVATAGNVGPGVTYEWYRKFSASGTYHLLGDQHDNYINTRGFEGEENVRLKCVVKIKSGPCIGRSASAEIVRTFMRGSTMVLSGGGNYCANASRPEVTFFSELDDEHTIGWNFKAYRNGSYLQPIGVHVGDTTTIINQGTYSTGSYTVVATKAGCETITFGPAVVSVIPATVVVAYNADRYWCPAGSSAVEVNTNSLDNKLYSDELANNLVPAADWSSTTTGNPSQPQKITINPSAFESSYHKIFYISNPNAQCTDGIKPIDEIRLIQSEEPVLVAEIVDDVVASVKCNEDIREFNFQVANTDPEYYRPPNLGGTGHGFEGFSAAYPVGFEWSGGSNELAIKKNWGSGIHSMTLAVFPLECPSQKKSNTEGYNILEELNKPEPPVLENNTTCFTGELDLQTSGFGSYEWYKSGAPFSFSNDNYVSELESGVGSYTVKGVYYEDSAEGIYCRTEMSDAVTVTTFTDAECDDFLNHVEAKTFGIDEAGNEIELAASKKYFDLAGEALQSQSTTYNAVGQKQVMASQSVTDTYGRPVLTTLAAPTNSSEFLYKHDFVSTTEDGKRVRYESRHFDAAGTKNSPNALDHEVPGTLGYYYGPNNTIEDNVPQTGFPYSRIEYEEDGTGDVKRASAPGEKLRMGAGHETYTDRLKVNSPGTELPNYNAIREKVVGINQPIDKVYKRELIDPDGKVTYSYHSPEGVVATKITDPADPTVTHWSYNFYNNAGRLAASMAPLGVENILTNGVPASVDGLLYTTTYTYDYQGHLIEMKEPDAGTTKYLYRKDGSIRFSENQEQRSEGHFSYTRYDESGRPVESGEYKGTDTYATRNATAILEAKGYSGFADTDREDWVETHYDIADATLGAAYEPDNFNLAGSLKKWYDQSMGAGYVDGNGYNNETRANVFAATYQQDFLEGVVSLTKNKEVTTWYSYDEFGLVTFIVMKYENMGTNGQFFTIDYQYDYYGNVTEVAYQKYFTGESFYHHYEYNDNQQLTHVYTSQVGENDPGKYLHATYHYYLHGPLKRVELAENLQGLDYTYTVQGWLKAINSPANDLDPGADGTNAFFQDAFGMEVDYYDGDHVSNQYTSVNAHTASTEQFGGNIRAITWGREGAIMDQALVYKEETYDSLLTEDTQVETQERIVLEPGFDTNNFAFVAMINPLATKDLPIDIEGQQYEYTYDFKNQLKEASYTDAVASAGSDDRYAVRGLAYDANGNIQTLQRYDEAGAEADNFTYTYVAQKNQLDNVSNYASYDYNTIGQMTASMGRGEYGDQYFDYDVTGKVIGIYASDSALNTKTDPLVSYEYDDRGFRIRKTVKDGLDSWYVRDASGNILAIYEDDGSSTQLKEHPIYGSGKIGTSFKNDYRHKYDYELTDHLGNVRAVVTKLKFFEVATMEDEFQVNESAIWENLNTNKQEDNQYNTTNINSTDRHSVRLDGINKVIGPAMSRQVLKGDKITFSAYAMYNDASASGALATDMLGFISSAYGVTSGGETQQIYDGLNDAVTAAAGFLGTTSDDAPKAYIQCLVFDKDFNNKTPQDAYVKIGTEAEGKANTAQWISKEIEMPEDGYIYIYVANETEGALVNFDDITVSIVGFEVTEMTDYYPFGSVAMQYQKESTEDYRFGYQGQFAEEDEESGFNHFEAREYDSKIGRWMLVDPVRQYHSPYISYANNPISVVDPDGRTGKPFSFKGHKAPENMWQRFQNWVFGLGHLNEIHDFTQESVNNHVAYSDGHAIGYTAGDEGITIQEFWEGGQTSWYYKHDSFEDADISFDPAPLGNVSRKIVQKSTPTVSAWVVRKVFKSLSPSVQKKFISAIQKGIVLPKGQQGIIKLASTEDMVKLGYTHKLKILGKGGDLRIYGKQLENGHIVFDYLTGH